MSGISQNELLSEIKKLKSQIQEQNSREETEDELTFGNIFNELFGSNGFDLSSVQEQLLTASLQNIPNPAYMLTIDRKISGINYHFSNLFNCSLENTLGKKLRDIFPLDISKLFAEQEKELLQNNGIADFEVEFELNGKTKFVVVGESVFTDLSGNPSGIIGVINDITDKRIAERELVESEKKLREANATKDKFLSIISHDLKSPFTSLLGFSDMLIQDYDDFSDDERKTFIREIRKSAFNAFDLLDNLLQWSRVVRDKIPYQPTPGNPRQLVDETISSLKAEIDKKEIHVTNLLEERQNIYSDHFMLSTVLKNVLSNSIKFTDNSGTVVIDSKKDNGFLNISILDNGIGISESDLNLLFRLDVHYKKIGNSKENGTGLGLILCKELITKNKGKIWVESTLGQGTKVTITVPFD